MEFPVGQSYQLKLAAARLKKGTILQSYNIVSYLRNLWSIFLFGTHLKQQNGGCPRFISQPSVCFTVLYTPPDYGHWAR